MNKLSKNMDVSIRNFQFRLRHYQIPVNGLVLINQHNLTQNQPSYNSCWFSKRTNLHATKKTPQSTLTQNQTIVLYYHSSFYSKAAPMQTTIHHFWYCPKHHNVTTTNYEINPIALKHIPTSTVIQSNLKQPLLTIN